MRKRININGRNINCRLESLICDTPAKSFILGVKGHCDYSSCTKCQTEGEYVGNRICFPQVDAPLRTDSFERLMITITSQMSPAVY